MTAPRTMTPSSVKSCRLAVLLGAALCLPACDRPQSDTTAVANTAGPSSVATAVPGPAEHAAAGPGPTAVGQPGTSVLQSILAPLPARTAGRDGATAIVPARADEPCLGLAGGALDECLLAELASAPESGESPVLREFREAQRQRDQELLHEEAQAIAGDGRQVMPEPGIEFEPDFEPEPIDADEAYARERDAQWQRERARLEREEQLQEDDLEDLPPEDFEP